MIICVRYKDDQQFFFLFHYFFCFSTDPSCHSEPLLSALNLVFKYLITFIYFFLIQITINAISLSLCYIGSNSTNCVAESTCSISAYGSERTVRRQFRQSLLVMRITKRSLVTLTKMSFDMGKELRLILKQTGVRWEKKDQTWVSLIQV